MKTLWRRWCEWRDLIHSLKADRVSRQWVQDQSYNRSGWEP